MQLETKHFRAELNEDIIRVQYKPNLHITLMDAEQIVFERLQYYRDLEAPVLIQNAKIVGIDKSAREYLFDRDRGLKNVKAVAIVYANVVNKLLATFLFHRHTPAIPHRMFTDEQKAITWLQNYV